MRDIVQRLLPIQITVHELIRRTEAFEILLNTSDLYRRMFRERIYHADLFSKTEQVTDKETFGRLEFCSRDSQQVVLPQFTNKTVYNYSTVSLNFRRPRR